MKKSIKFLVGFAVSDLILWLAMSPRIATKLYHSKLFKSNGVRGSMQSLRDFNEVQTSEITFRAKDGTPLRGWFYKHPTSSKVFIYNQGRSSDLGKSLTYAKVMLAAGASVFCYEYRGFGDTPGKPSVVGICEDGLTAYDYVSGKLGYQADNIVIYGESLGAGVAAYVSERRKAAGLVLQSGFASLERIGKDMVTALRVYPSWLFPRPSLDNAKAVTHAHPPLLVIHGVNDEVIPVHHSRLIYDGACGSKQLVQLPNSGHTNLVEADGPAFVGALRSFLTALA
jgi:fermentation-respiration switch protein FrsA (DUF1100 family)